MTAAAREPAAVVAAGEGTAAWRRAVIAQRDATADHGDFYALAAELVDTLWALGLLVELLATQVAGYGRDRAVRDDAGMSPATRLASAAALLQITRDALGDTHRRAGEGWAELSHIGLEDV